MAVATLGAPSVPVLNVRQFQAAPAPVQTAAVAAAPEFNTSSQVTGQNVEDKKGALASALSGPSRAERRSGAESASNQAWERVGNPETWKKAGVSKEDMAGIQERSEAGALKMAKGDKKNPDFGEFAYIAQAGELASWAENAAKTGGGGSATALRDMAQGGTDYMKTRSEFLQLRGN